MLKKRIIMLNEQQKQFRKQMREIKKEKGDLYYEIYDEYTPNRLWKDTRPINTGRWLRLTMLLCFIGWRVYNSGVLTSILGNQDYLSTVNIERSAMLLNTTPSFEQQKCSEYLQFIREVNENSSDVMNNYFQGNIEFFMARATINNLLEDMEQIKVIQYGEALHENTVGRLARYIDYIEIHEELIMTRVINTKKEEAIWQQKQAYAEELRNQLQVLSNDYIEITKALLEKYNMRYTQETDKSIRYYYKK